MLKLDSYFSAARNFLLFIISAAFLSSAIPASSMTLDSLDMHLKRLVEKASKSIVTVESVISRKDQRSNNTRGSVAANLISSGIIIDTAGLILTSAASVYDYPVHYVWYNDKPHKAKLSAVDYRTGLALLKSDIKGGLPVRLFDDEPSMGQMMVALGNAYGMSAAPSLGFCVGLRADDKLQFSAPISSGSIGGGLFTMTGELAGVIVSGFGHGTETQTGIAIPAFQIKEVIDHMLCCGTRKAGYLGISTADMEYYESYSSNTSGASVTNTIKGVYITDVVKNSPAEKAGLRTGDIITSINSLPVLSAEELMHYVMRSIPGSITNFRILRSSREVALQATLGAASITSPGSAIYDRPDSKTNPKVDSLQNLIMSLENEIKNIQTQVLQNR